MLRACVLLSVLTLCVSCATSSGRMPNPPTDEELASDGSPEAREKLFERYGVKDRKSPLTTLLPRMREVTVGEARRPYTIEYVTHSDVRTYLESNPAAAAELKSVGYEVAAMALLLGSQFLLPPALLVMLGALGVTAVGEWGTVPQLKGIGLIALPVGIAAVLASIAVALPLSLVGSFLSKRAENGRDRAIQAFNRGLQTRIGNAVRAPKAPAPVLPRVVVADATACVTAEALQTELRALLAPAPSWRNAELVVAVSAVPAAPDRRQVTLVARRGAAGEAPLERTLDIPAAECADVARVLARIAAANFETPAAAP